MLEKAHETRHRRKHIAGEAARPQPVWRMPQATQCGPMAVWTMQKTTRKNGEDRARKKVVLRHLRRSVFSGLVGVSSFVDLEKSNLRGISLRYSQGGLQDIVCPVPTCAKPETSSGQGAQQSAHKPASNAARARAGARSGGAGPPRGRASRRRPERPISRQGWRAATDRGWAHTLVNNQTCSAIFGSSSTADFDHVLARFNRLRGWARPVLGEPKSGVLAARQVLRETRCRACPSPIASASNRSAPA